MRLEIVRAYVQNRRGIDVYSSAEIARMQSSVESVLGFRMYSPKLPDQERRVMFSPPVDGFNAAQLMSILINAGFGDCYSEKMELPSSEKD